MPKITYIEHETDKEHTVELSEGMSLMEGAVKFAVPGIDGDCGGACACATCHIYIDPDWAERVEPMDELEKGMLDFAFDVQDNSRLSCQVRVTQDHEGLVVRTPKRQY